MSKKGPCSPPSKRRRKYSEVTFAQYRMNEFLDWMMLATEEEKDWVTLFLLRGYIVNQSWRWEWLVYGECLEFIAGNRESAFQFDRLSHVKHHHMYRIVDTLWLKKQDATLYENGPIDFWILVAQRLEYPNSILAFSLVSKKHYRVARMDIVYEKWIRLYLKKRGNFYSNPFAHLPLWRQFLIFIGVPKDEVWIQWTKESTEHLFFIVVVAGGLGYAQTPADAIFDLKTKTIRRANGTPFFWIEKNGRWMIDGRQHFKKRITWGCRGFMERVMKDLVFI